MASTTQTTAPATPQTQSQQDASHGDLRKAAFLQRRAEYQTQMSAAGNRQAQPGAALAKQR